MRVHFGVFEPHAPNESAKLPPRLSFPFFGIVGAMVAATR
jgi:hypothetical protein